MERGDIALQGAVGLHRDKSALCAKASALRVNNSDVVGIDLRHDHRNVISPAMGGIIGNNGTFQLGVALLQCPDLFLFHIHGAETEIHGGSQLFRIGLGVQYPNVLCLLRTGDVQRPAAANGLPIGFAGAFGAGGNSGEPEPRMVFQQCDKALTHHTGGANDAYFKFFFVCHKKLPSDACSKISECG